MPRTTKTKVNAPRQSETKTKNAKARQKSARPLGKRVARAAKPSLALRLRQRLQLRSSALCPVAARFAAFPG